MFGEIEEEKVPTVILTREYHENGTHGTIKFPSGVEIHTAERPWLDNKRGVSCIPEGEYNLGMRESPVVSRSTRGRYRKGWEVQNVPDRSFIMFHPGNWPLIDSDGCILPGMSKSFDRGDEPVVWRSQEAMDIFMKQMKDEKIEKIAIRS